MMISDRRRAVSAGEARGRIYRIEEMEKKEGVGKIKYNADGQGGRCLVAEYSLDMFGLDVC
jgi:hypothetical protein